MGCPFGSEHEGHAWSETLLTVTDAWKAGRRRGGLEADVKDRLEWTPTFCLLRLFVYMKVRRVRPPEPTCANSLPRRVGAGWARAVDRRRAGLTSALLQLDALAHVDVVDPDVASGRVIEESFEHHLDARDTENEVLPISLNLSLLCNRQNSDITAVNKDSGFCPKVELISICVQNVLKSRDSCKKTNSNGKQYKLCMKRTISSPFLSCICCWAAPFKSAPTEISTCVFSFFIHGVGNNPRCLFIAIRQRVVEEKSMLSDWLRGDSRV